MIKRSVKSLIILPLILGKESRSSSIILTERKISMKFMKIRMNTSLILQIQTYHLQKTQTWTSRLFHGKWKVKFYTAQMVQIEINKNSKNL